MSYLLLRVALVLAAYCQATCTNGIAANCTTSFECKNNHIPWSPKKWVIPLNPFHKNGKNMYFSMDVGSPNQKMPMQTSLDSPGLALID